MMTIQPLQIGPIRARPMAGPDDTGRHRWRLEWYPPGLRGRMETKAIGWLDGAGVERVVQSFVMPLPKTVPEFHWRSAAERFWPRVDKNGPTMPHMGTSCWLWTGGSLKGYGAFRLDGKQRLAHRVLYEWATGEPCTAPVLMHRCDVPLCVRPDHMRPGTQAENIADCIAKGRR